MNSYSEMSVKVCISTFFIIIDLYYHVDTVTIISQFGQQ